MKDLDLGVQPNDKLIVQLLGVHHLNVYYDEIPETLAEGYSLKPTSATVFVKLPFPFESREEEKHRLLNAAVDWIASKTGISADNVSVEELT